MLADRSATARTCRAVREERAELECVGAGRTEVNRSAACIARQAVGHERAVAEHIVDSGARVIDGTAAGRGIAVERVVPAGQIQRP